MDTIMKTLEGTVTLGDAYSKPSICLTNADVGAVADVSRAQAERISKIQRYWRASNYLAAASIYLRDPTNALLREPLRPDHIKARLLGHWGTCPGINFIYAHLNRLIIDSEGLEMLLVTGPGHGAPANLANLFLEGTLGEVYPACSRDAAGVGELVRAFSTPYGFPTHLGAHLPGTIHEGGELGYSLSVAHGAAMDLPDLVVACIVGDGEAETGPLAAAWQSIKFVDPAVSGAVLPIVHLNGHKIGNPTVLGTMADAELLLYFAGLGYEPRIVGAGGLGEIDADMIASLDWALARIRAIQEQDARGRPRWPVLLLRSPKGWTCPKTIKGKAVEGTAAAHQARPPAGASGPRAGVEAAGAQVPAKGARTDPEELRALEAWLRSYRPEELFDERGAPAPDILATIPPGGRRLGRCRYGFGGALRGELVLPPLEAIGVPLDPAQRGRALASATDALAGRLLAPAIDANRTRFRVFSPDEIESNQMGAIFGAPTEREYEWPHGRHDAHIGAGRNGRVLEILSEHTLQGWLQGYTMTGGFGVFVSYEAFLGIVATMMDQYAKFLKVHMERPWRAPMPAITYLETSTLWRQEHNGFSHQNPGFINALLSKKPSVARVYLPPDANTLLACAHHCLASYNRVNLLVAAKQPFPQWLTPEEARRHVRDGASVWWWAGTEAEGSPEGPDVVLCGAGAEMTLEVVAAADLLRRACPGIRLRVVNVVDLFCLRRPGEGLPEGHPHGLPEPLFEALFTPDRPVLFAFHGYPAAAHDLLFGRRPESVARFEVRGYIEEGDTTTPFDMCVRNRTSRFDLLLAAVALAAPSNPAVAAVAVSVTREYEAKLGEHEGYIRREGRDLPEVTGWQLADPRPRPADPL